MEARARSGGLANDLGGVPPDYFVIKLYQMLREQKEVIASVPRVRGRRRSIRKRRSILNARFVGGTPRAASSSTTGSGSRRRCPSTSGTTGSRRFKDN